MSWAGLDTAPPQATARLPYISSRGYPSTAASFRSVTGLAGSSLPLTRLTPASPELVHQSVHWGLLGTPINPLQHTTHESILLLDTSMLGGHAR